MRGNWYTQQHAWQLGFLGSALLLAVLIAANAPAPSHIDENGEPISSQAMAGTFAPGEMLTQRTIRGVPLLPQVPVDAVPPLTNPAHVSAEEADAWLREDDVVIGVSLADESRAYPRRIMNWHEVVNDTLGGRAIAVTYNPLGNVAAVFDRTLDRETILLGHAGAIYESAPVFYDRQTHSLWYQVSGAAIAGPLEDIRMARVPARLVSWGVWRTKNPETRVLSRDTGVDRRYRSDWFVDATSPDGPPPFPVSRHSALLPPKTPVVGIEMHGVPKAYPLKEHAGEIIEDRVGGRLVEVVVDEDGLGAEVFMVGGQAREPVPQIHAFWFAWYAANPETKVYGLDDSGA